MKTVEFYNEYHLGDSVFHIMFLRKLCRLVDDNFIYYVNPALLPELNKHLLGYLDRIELRDIKFRTPTAINAWVGEIYYNHPGRYIFDTFYIDWHNYLTEKLYNKKFDLDIISDYPLLASTGKYQADILFINSVPNSNQFENNTSLLDSTIQQLNVHYRVITTKKVEGVVCTMDKGMSLVDIGALASDSKNIIAINTGPITCCINQWALANVQSWIVAAHNHTYSFPNVTNVRNIPELINEVNKVYLRN